MSYTSRRDPDLGPFEDDYRGFDMRDEDTARGPLILALALGVLLVFGAVVWNTYRQGVRPGAGDVPIIAAEAAPFKRAPDQRGGQGGDDLNKRIYDQIDGSTRDDVVRAQQAAADAPAVRQRGGPPMDLRGPQDGAAPVEEQADALRELAGGAPSGEIETGDLAALSPTPRVNAITEPRLPVPDPEPAITPAPRPAPASLFAFEARGAFLVQIAALRSQDAADRAWRQAVAKSPDTFRGAAKSIQRADLGAKGVFYRLRAGAFATRDDANAFCSALKADGGQCIVVAR